jgi:hypothetical protein
VEIEMVLQEGIKEVLASYPAEFSEKKNLFTVGL